MEEEIDLDQILTPEERRHYQRFLGQSRIVTFVHPAQETPWTWTATNIYDNDPAQYDVLRQIEKHMTRDDVLFQHGYGQVVCSSSQVVALSPEICWDVCLYYRRLGLHWKATRKQIRDALMARGAIHGAGKAELVYAAKQLLDEDLRREYDRVPLGMLFLKDKDVVALLKRAAQQAASAMAARGFRQVTPEDVLGNWGFQVGDAGGPVGEGEESQPQSAAPPPSPARAFSWDSQWAWYSDPKVKYERTSDMIGGVPLYRLRELEEWQQLLVRAFSRRGMAVQFAVGLCDSETFLIRPAPNPGILVILLGKGGPTPELASDAVDMWGFAGEPKSQGATHAAFR